MVAKNSCTTKQHCSKKINTGNISQKTEKRKCTESLNTKSFRKVTGFQTLARTFLIILDS